MTVRTGLGMALMAAFLLAGTGCANKQDAEMDGLRTQNQELKQKSDAQAAQLDSLQKQLAMVTAQNTAQPPQADPVVTPGMEGTGGTVDLSSGGRGVAPRPIGGTGRPATGSGAGASATATKEVTIEIPGDVLFDSGQTKLKPTAEKTLDALVVELKKTYSGRSLRIDGHTDPTPVKASAKGGYSNNYELGLMRAKSVMAYLEKKGIPSKSMTVKSFGDTNPKSKTNLALDRRVDIVVLK